MKLGHGLELTKQEWQKLVQVDREAENRHSLLLPKMNTDKKRVI